MTQFSKEKKYYREPIAEYTMSLRKEEESLLESRIQSNMLQYPTGILSVVALIVSFQPVFLCHTMLGMSWSTMPNPVLYVIVTLLSTWMMEKAYVLMVQSEFWGRQRHYTEVKSSEDEQLLRTIRLQCSMGYTFFFLNTGFFLLNTFCICCLFHQMDVRAKYFISPLLTSALLWLISQKNEETRQKRLRLHR